MDEKHLLSFVFIFSLCFNGKEKEKKKISQKANMCCRMPRSVLFLMSINKRRRTI